MPVAVRLSEAIDEYLAVLKARGDKSHTIMCKKSTLLRFLSVVGNIYPKSLGVHHVDAFLVKHADWEQSTKKLNISYLSAFQNWLHSRRYLDRHVDILEGKRKIKVPRKRRPRVGAEKFDVLLDRAPVHRDRVIVAICLFLAVRVSEMVTIQWKHVDLDEGWAEVYRHKTGEYDTLPIIDELREELLRWRVAVCRHKSVIAPDPEWYVTCAMDRARIQDEKGRFVGATGDVKLIPELPLKNPLPRLKAIFVELGINEPGMGMHTLRRSGATALEGAMRALAVENPELAIDPIGVVQAQLGHANRTTTEIYLDRDANKARRDALLRGKRLYGKASSAGTVTPLRAVGEVRGGEEGAGV